MSETTTTLIVALAGLASALTAWIRAELAHRKINRQRARLMQPQVSGRGVSSLPPSGSTGNA